MDPIGGPHKTVPPTPEEFWKYVNDEALGTAFVIYEKESTLSAFAKKGLMFVPIYWERNPRCPAIPRSAFAIKLHPYIEQYDLIATNVGPSLDVARYQGLFVFIHLDDRTPDCSRGRLVKALARQYPDVIFVMAHSGSYAPPRPDMPGTSWVSETLIRELVTEAVEVAQTCDNVFLETSILASDVKAHILAGAPTAKMLLGSDFPILAGTPWASIRSQEDQLLRFGKNLADIDRLHTNAAALANLRGLA